MTKKFNLSWLPILFFLVAYLLPLANRPLISPDEFRYAEIPRTMVDTGDYVSPRLLGIRYFEKPALGYQITAVAMKMFGENRFSIRLGSALAVALTAWLLFFAVKRLRKDEEEACWASLLYMAGGLVFGVGTYAVLDSQTTAFVTGTVLSYFVAISETSKKKRFLFLALCGIFCGLAFLTKGFLAMAVPAVTVLPYLIWSKRYKEIFTTPWIPMIFMVATALPWSLMIHLREPDFWRYFFWIEHVQRFFSKTADGQHPEPFYALILPYAVGLLPGMLAALGAFVVLKREFKSILKDDFCRFMLCYAIFPFLFFSASSGKLATYVLPCFPPIAILLSLGMIKYWQNGGQAVPATAFKILRIIFCIALPLFILYALLPLPAEFRLYTNSEWLKWAVPALAVTVWCTVLYKLKKASIRTQTIGFFVGLMFAFAASSLALPTEIMGGKTLEAPLQRLSEKVPKDAILVAYPNVMHGVGWIFERDDIYIFIKSGELEDSIEKSYPDEYRHRLLSLQEIGPLADSSEEDVVILIRIKPEQLDERVERYLSRINREPKYQDYDHEIWMVAF